MMSLSRRDFALLLLAPVVVPMPAIGASWRRQVLCVRITQGAAALKVVIEDARAATERLSQSIETLSRAQWGAG